MLYLEDYLEIIENLPQELCDRFTAIRELDLQVHNEMDVLEVRANNFFSNAHLMSTEMRDSQFDKIKQEYYKTFEEAEEKVSLANQLYELVDKYLRRLEHEVLKFKIELEADNAGITEILEKRSLDLDSPKTSSNHIREKRKLVFSTETMNQKSSPLPTDKMLHDISQGRFNSGINSLVSSKQILNTPLSATNSIDKPGCFSFFNSKVNTDKKNINTKFNITGNNAIAAAASQAIAATQQMQLGRRSASLKASFEAINSNNINPIRLDDSLDSNAHNPFLKISNGLEDSDKSMKRVRMNKRSRTSSQFNIDLSNNNSNATSSDTMNTEWSSVDPGEQRYCTCNNISYGEMIYCENNQCPFQWFHLDCVGIKVPPAGSWFCPRCSADKKERKKKE